MEPGSVVIDLPGFAGSTGQPNNGGGGSSGDAGSAGTGGTAGDGSLPDGGLAPEPDGGTGPDSDACAVSFVTPSPAAVPLTFGPGDDRDGTPCGSGFTTDVVVASSGVSVTLFVDGTPWAAQLLSAGSSSFEGVLLGSRTPTTSTLRAVATAADGGSCEATLGPVSVDCTVPPSVEIASPTTGTSINQLGTSGAIADLTPGSATCEVAVAVHCSELGSDVVLSVDGTPLAQGMPCLAGGDAVLPYRGTATFDSISLGTLTETHTLQARQTVAGLVGSSAAVILDSDCEPPVLAVSDPLCAGQLHVLDDDTLSGVAGLQHDVAVSNGGVPQVSLTVARTDGSEQLSATGDETSTSFPDVDFGDPGDVTLTVTATDGAGNVGTASCLVTVVEEPTVNILVPSAQQILTTANDCVPVGGGFGITVSGTTSAAAGSAATVAIGAGVPVSIAPVASGSGGLGSFSGCVAIADGSGQTLTVTVIDAPNPPGSDSVGVSVDTLAPSDPVLAPFASLTNRRRGQATFIWNHVVDSDGSALAGYEMRCAAALISDETGWAAARQLTVNTVGALSGTASELIPSPSCTGDFCRGFRVGTSEFCVMRGRDIAGALTPLLGASGNVAVSVPFISTSFSSVLNGNSSFTNVVALGDVNGDGADDMLYGVTPLGLQLFFGGTSFDTTADVSFSNGGVSAFGAVLASVGDVNGDGIPDFAASARALGGNAGTVYLFFGKASNTWASSIVVNAGGCGADVCLVGSAAGAFFGWDITGTNFDGSGPNDLVISARTANGGLGAVYVVLGGSQLNVAPGTSISVPGGNPDGFVITPPASRSNFGVAIAAVGAGGDGRGDLAIGANGAGTANPAALFYLRGEAYPGGSSGLIAPTATPLLEVAFGSSGDYGAPVRGVGDFDGDGFADLALGRNFSSSGGLGAAQLYRRNEPVFSAGPGFVFDFPATGVDNDYATFIATGFHPSLGNVGDLDGDGLTELAVGSLAGTSGGSMALFYGAKTITGRVRSGADFTLAGSATSLLVPNFVGDFDGDGFNDLAVVDGGSGADRLVLLH
jgi:hypothetical protein